MNKKVLLTGISGYIALHCAKILLEKGYTVVGTVRSTKKEDEVIKTLNSNSVSIENLSFTHLDLSSDKGWDSALSNCNYVMHVASPFTVENPKNESDMLGPAVDGTLRVLKAAKKNGVKRVVLTSSIVAIMGGKKTGTITILSIQIIIPIKSIGTNDPAKYFIKNGVMIGASKVAKAVRVTDKAIFAFAK